jgi:hypothetical protein
VIRKLSGPTGQMEMEKGPTGTCDTLVGWRRVPQVHLGWSDGERTERRLL